MRPDLKAHDITAIHLSVDLSISDELIAQIHEASPPDDDGDSIFVDSYKADRRNHKAWAWVLRKREATEICKIGLYYELGKAPGGTKLLPSLTYLVDMLSSTEEMANIICQVFFSFGKRRKPRPIVRLPMKLVESPSIPFDEISGVHLVKREGQSVKYDVILDVLPNGTLSENIVFQHRSKIEESLVDAVMREAVTISDQLVLKGE